jgi:hypothetical protein
MAGTAVASTPPASPSAVRAALGPGLRAAPASIPASAVQNCAKVAAKAGFSYAATADGYAQIVVAVSIAMAESSCNPNARLVNTNGCVDRGLWQIDNCAWPNVSNACAYQVQCNADAAFDISDHGSDWGPWSTFQEGVWRNYISDAEGAINGFSFQLKSAGAGTCLEADSKEARDAGVVYQWGCQSGNRYQQWEVVHAGLNNPVLRNEGTGFCLDADGGKVGNGDPIFQWKCAATDHFQEWMFRGSGGLSSNAKADILNVAARNCLDADGAKRGNGDPIFQWKCSPSDSMQLWD